MSDLGRALMVLGIVLFAVGVLLTLRVPWLGRLPGDFSFGGPNWKVYIPLGTCIAVSLVLSLLFYLVSLLSRR